MKNAVNSSDLNTDMTKISQLGQFLDNCTDKLLATERSVYSLIEAAELDNAKQVIAGFSGKRRDISEVRNTSIRACVEAATQTEVSLLYSVKKAFCRKNKPTDYDPKFEVLCRLCACLFHQDSVVEIFRHVGKAKKLDKMIDGILPKMVKRQDGLPQHVCRSCIDKLTVCCLIRDGFLEADKKFQALMYDESAMDVQDSDNADLSEPETQWTPYLCDSNGEPLPVVEEVTPVQDQQSIEEDLKQPKKRRRLHDNAVDLSVLDPEHDSGLEVEWYVDDEVLHTAVSRQLESENRGPSKSRDGEVNNIVKRMEDSLSTHMSGKKLSETQVFIDPETISLQLPSDDNHVSSTEKPKSPPQNADNISDLKKQVSTSTPATDVNSSIPSNNNIINTINTQPPGGKKSKKKTMGGSLNTIILNSSFDFKCEECNFSSMSRRGLSIHKGNVHNSKNWSTSGPNARRTPSKAVLGTDKKAGKSSVESRSMPELADGCDAASLRIAQEEFITCSSCLLTFSNKREAYIHKVTEHSEEIIPTMYSAIRGQPDSGTFIEPVFNTKLGLSTKQHKCRICRLTFRNENGLLIHENLVHEKPIPNLKFICTKCGLVFKYKKDLSEHKCIDIPMTSQHMEKPVHSVSLMVKPVQSNPLTEKTLQMVAVTEKPQQPEDKLMEKSVKLSPLLKQPLKSTFPSEQLVQSIAVTENPLQSLNLIQKPVSSMEKTVRSVPLLEESDKVISQEEKPVQSIPLASNLIISAPAKETSVQSISVKNELVQPKFPTEETVPFVPLTEKPMQSVGLTQNDVMPSPKSEKLVESVHQSISITSDLKFICSKCEVVFTDEKGITEHDCSNLSVKLERKQEPSKQEHTQDSTFLCNECGEMFSQCEALEDHEKLHKTSHSTCHICGKIFLQESLLSSHLQTHEKCATSVLQCNTCKKKFFNPNTLLRHKKECISSSSKTITQTKVGYICIICNKGFYKEVNARLHTAIHTDSVPFRCRQCMKAFRNRTSLITHRAVHKAFATRSVEAVEFHIAIGTELRQQGTGSDDKRGATCQMCGRVLTDVSSLRTHMARHSAKDLSSGAMNIRELNS